jgi:FkbM family methyltransferase
MMTVLQKVQAGARILLSTELWGIAFREVRKARVPLPEAPRAHVVADDAATGMYAAEIAGHRYWLPVGMDPAGLSMLYPEVFFAAHPHYYESASCCIRPGDVVVDAGASEGFFTRFALQRGASVLAVEPWGPMAQCLRRTYAEEISAGRVWIEEAALADEEGESTLHVDPKQPWGANTTVGARSVDVTVTVRRTTVDALVPASPFGRCDFLKMDVEGIERDAIRGARESLHRDRPCVSIAVYHHPTGYLDIKADLLSLGLGYRIAGKGTTRRRGLSIPMILHAWPPERE